MLNYSGTHGLFIRKSTVVSYNKVWCLCVSVTHTRKDLTHVADDSRGADI